MVAGGGGAVNGGTVSLGGGGWRDGIGRGGGGV